VDNKALIRISDISKEYIVGDVILRAVDKVSFEILEGEFAVVLGPSGAGKSTILNLLGGMDRATSGDLFVDDKNITKYSERQLTTYRRQDVGFVFQFYNLMPNLTAKENVELALKVGKDPLDVESVMKEVGLYDRMNHFPAKLSGGEQQRVAIARAICKNPKLLLCDEPTGALDSETGRNILIQLQNMSKVHGKTVVIITHNGSLQEAADRVIHVRSGKISKIDLNKNAVPVENIKW